MHQGLPVLCAIRHYEFSVNIAENQTLRTACKRMLFVPRSTGSLPACRYGREGRAQKSERRPAVPQGALVAYV